MVALSVAQLLRHYSCAVNVEGVYSGYLEDRFEWRHGCYHQLPLLFRQHGCQLSTWRLW